MSIINLAGMNVSENSYRRAREIVDGKNLAPGTQKTRQGVLDSIRQMMPDWTVTTNKSDWGDGHRNLEVGEGILQRMADDPEAMVRYKALILELEDIAPVIEEWKEKPENEGKTFEFKISMEDGNITRAKGIVRTLMGGEIRTTFDLPNNQATRWADIIRQKLESLNEGQTEDAYGERSWMG